LVSGLVDLSGLVDRIYLTPATVDEARVLLPSFCRSQRLSAYNSKADILRAGLNVCYVPEADIAKNLRSEDRRSGWSKLFFFRRNRGHNATTGFSGNRLWWPIAKLWPERLVADRESEIGAH
jgi:hypothetical protein